VTATGGTSLNAWDPARHLVDLPRPGDAAPRSRAPFPPGPAAHRHETASSWRSSAPYHSTPSPTPNLSKQRRL